MDEFVPRCFPLEQVRQLAGGKERVIAVDNRLSRFSAGIPPQLTRLWEVCGRELLGEGVGSEDVGENK